MLTIETGKNFEIENVLSLRKQMSQRQVNEEIVKIQQYLKENNIKKNGPLISTTFSMQTVKGEQVLDMEFLIPIDQEVTFDNEYTFKKKISLVNAVFAKHIGNPATLQNTYKEINNYITEHNLKPMASLYSINVKEAKSPLEINDMVTELYLPVNPCIL